MISGWLPIGTGYFDVYIGTSFCGLDQLLFKTSNRQLNSGWFTEIITSVISIPNATHLSFVPLGVSNDSNVDRPYMTMDNLQINLRCADTDGDGITNDKDLDSDNDGIPDAVEACGNLSLSLEQCNLDADANGVYALDANGCRNGLISGSGCMPINNSDNDGILDFLDLDSDNDGCSDAEESGTNSFNGINGLTFADPAASTENCGLVISAQDGVCNIPENQDWLNATEINVCNPECDLNDPNADCDEDGVVNALDCDPEDENNTITIFGSNCLNNNLIFNFGN